MNRRIATIGVVALLVLSGCSAVGLGETGADGSDGASTVTEPLKTPPTSTATPTPTATPTATATPDADALDPVSAMDSLPPGVTASGVADKSALLDAYRNRLSAGSYALVTEIRNSSGPDSRLVLRNDTEATLLRVEPGDRDAALTLYDGAPTFGVHNGSSGEVAYGHGAASLSSRVSLLQIFVVNFGTEWLRAMEWEPVGVATADGEQRLVFEASSLNETVARDGGLVVPPVLSDGTEVRDVDARMAVTSEGLVRHANVTITADVDGTVRTATTALTVERVEPVSLSEPAWLDDAPQVSLSSAEDDRLVALDHLGGAAIESGTTLSVSTEGEHVGNVTVSESVGSGDTLYVHRTGDGDDAAVHLTVNERPELSENATAFAGRVRVTGEQGDATFQAGVKTDEQ
ncbi:DUF7537 family lipoprotein [Halosimplex salinum]|uniref:DUF7537 family lipoprotein n=1 Tax=Halosimplex salinum TaxID=1710538 RepID=UPI000F4965E7|nr:hypothetical protein [Halosimplex salinum]